MKIRTTIDRSYSFLAVRRKRRLVAYACISMACATVVCMVIEMGLPMPSIPTAVEPNLTMLARANNQQIVLSVDSGQSSSQVVSRKESSLHNLDQ